MEEAYIIHTKERLAKLRPQAQLLLDQERDAYLRGDEDALVAIRKLSDPIFRRINRLEETLMIYESLSRVRC